MAGSCGQQQYHAPGMPDSHHQTKVCSTAGLFFCCCLRSYLGSIRRQCSPRCIQLKAGGTHRCTDERPSLSRSVVVHQACCSNSKQCAVPTVAAAAYSMLVLVLAIWLAFALEWLLCRVRGPGDLDRYGTWWGGTDVDLEEQIDEVLFLQLALYCLLCGPAQECSAKPPALAWQRRLGQGMHPLQPCECKRGLA